MRTASRKIKATGLVCAHGVEENQGNGASSCARRRGKSRQRGYFSGHRSRNQGSVLGVLASFMGRGAWLGLPCWCSIQPH